MRAYEIPRSVLDRFASEGVDMEFLPAALDGATTRVTVARMAQGGVLGSHAATLSQVFAVLDGTVVVSTGAMDVDGDAGARAVVTRLGAGRLVVWDRGEVHESRAVTAAVVAIVETSGEFDLPPDFVGLP